MLKIHKGQPVGNETIPDASIEIAECLPYNANVRTAEKMMSTDAIRLVSVLHNTLPQGTWARAVAEIALKWGHDQSGIISARAWNPVDEAVGK